MVLKALLAGGMAFLLFAPLACGAQANPLQECINHQQVVMHIHPRLTLIVEGKRVKVPANIGITAQCMRPVHTHDDSGTLHIEYRRWHEFTLGDFFQVWTDNPYRDKPVAQVWVDERLYPGDPNKLVLKDGQQIVIYLGPSP